MANNHIQISPRMRPAVDVERLARALLDLIDHLSVEDRQAFIAEGDRVLKEARDQTKPKGSAA
jgi:hypothetical protein